MKKKNIFIVSALTLATLIGASLSLINKPAVGAKALKEGEQGYNNWYYLFGDAKSTYYEMTYNLSLGRWYYDETEPYANLSNDSSHPGNGGDAIRAFRAPYDGTINLGVSLDHGSPEGDGVRVSIGRRNLLEDGTYSQYVELKAIEQLKFSSARLDIDVDTPMKRGDLFMISVNKRVTDQNDSCALIPIVTTEKTADGIDYADGGIGASHKVDSTSFYALKQGEKNWFYCFGDIGKYVLMKYGNVNDGTRTWRGNYPYQQIGKTYMHPADRYKTIRVWVCDTPGKISIEGKIRHETPYGDGVRAGITFNEQSIYDITIEGSDDKNHSLPESLLNMTVKVGDRIAIWMDAGAKLNNNNDGTDFALELFYTQKTGEKTNRPLTDFITLYEKEGDIFDVVDLDYDYKPDKEELAKIITNAQRREHVRSAVKVVEDNIKENKEVYIALITALIVIGTGIGVSILIIKKGKGKLYAILPLILALGAGSIGGSMLYISNHSIAAKADELVFDNIADFATKQGYNNWYYYCGEVENEKEYMVYNYFDSKIKDLTGIGFIQKDQWQPSYNGEIMAAFKAPKAGTLSITYDVKVLELQVTGSDGVAFYMYSARDNEYFGQTTLKGNKLETNGTLEYQINEDEEFYFIMHGIASEGGDRSYVHLQVRYK